MLSIHCRLYAWDCESASWKERGRGNLRFNDTVRNEKLCSRLGKKRELVISYLIDAVLCCSVMRTSGALRVILNTHLVAGMKFELANDQCLRFTNIDGIFLIKASPTKRPITLSVYKQQ